MLGNKIVITTGPIVNFKLKYPQFSFCFGKKCTVETLNILSHRYANYMHHSQVSFCYDETTK